VEGGEIEGEEGGQQVDSVNNCQQKEKSEENSLINNYVNVQNSI
jgi:hypothetical protein